MGVFHKSDSTKIQFLISSPDILRQLTHIFVCLNNMFWKKVISGAKFQVMCFHGLQQQNFPQILNNTPETANNVMQWFLHGLKRYDRLWPSSCFYWNASSIIFIHICLIHWGSQISWDQTKLLFFFIKVDWDPKCRPKRKWPYMMLGVVEAN